MHAATNGRAIGRSTERAESRTHIAGIHSHRGGAGKTTLAANLAYLAARAGARVAVIDGDLQAPALHVALGVDTKRILHSVSEFVRGRCDLAEVPIDLSRELELEDDAKLWFLPASTDLQTTTSLLFDGYDVARLNEHVRRLAAELQLDLVILDTHMGINRETLLSLATSETVLVLVRPDEHGSEGASVIAHIAEKVGVPSCLIVPNMIPEDCDAEALRERLEQELGAPSAALLPWCAEIAGPRREGLFAARHPEHAFTAALERVARSLLPAPVAAGGES